MLKGNAMCQRSALLLTSLFVGCAGEVEDARDESERALLAATDAGLAADGSAGGRPLRPLPPVNVKAADGSDFVELRTQGNGCPAGSVRASVGQDGAINLTFAAYRLEAGSAVTWALRECQITLVPLQTEAREYSLTEVRFAGRLALEPGAKASLLLSRYLEGDPTLLMTMTRRVDFAGPRDAPFQAAIPAQPEQVRWSPCGASPKIYVSPRLEIARAAASSGASIIDLTTGGPDGRSGMTVRLESRVCPPNNG